VKTNDPLFTFRLESNGDFHKKSKTMIKNNVTRLLDTKGIPYKPCPLPNKKLSAIEVAEYLDVSAALVYKTIVVERQEHGKPILALVPARNQVNTKALAKVIGEKKVSVVTLEKAEKITGLKAGGISPLALLHKPFEVILDSSVQQHDQIYISGGQWGLNILIAPDDIIKLTGAKTANITKK
jgi:Cys-tRNA(Pro)/Cys-tRNA(Cys) deacylase